MKCNRQDHETNEHVHDFTANSRTQITNKTGCKILNGLRKPCENNCKSKLTTNPLIFKNSIHVHVSVLTEMIRNESYFLTDILMHMAFENK